MDVFKLPQQDGYLSASDVKDIAEDVIMPLSLPGIEGLPLNSVNIWMVVILACVNQTSIWETCKETDGTPCDKTVLAWLHTLDRHWLEFVANLLLKRLAMTIFDRVEAYPFEIDLLLADRGFYNDDVLRWSRDIAATVIPVRKNGDRLKVKLDVHKSYMTTYRMCKDQEWELFGRAGDANGEWQRS